MVCLHRYLLKIFAIKEYIIDSYNHLHYSVNYHSDSNLTKDMYRCRIMLLNHQLEKAQTYSNPKKDYGKSKIILLLKYVRTYISNFGYDSLIITAIGVMNSHLESKYAYKDERITDEIKKISTGIDYDMKSNYGGGINHINKKSYIYIKDLPLFFSQRHSCREYSQADLDHEYIRNAVKLAQTAPSACNRQSIRVHYYYKHSEIEQIIRAQESDINWCLNAKGLMIITANRSYFRDYYERNQRMFDAGLFAMNLVLALHNMGIGSCFKMAQKNNRIEKATKTIAKIPKIEDICVLLLMGKYPDSDMIFAKSVRLPLEEVLKIHN